MSTEIQVNASRITSLTNETALAATGSFPQIRHSVQIEEITSFSLVETPDLVNRPTLTPPACKLLPSADLTSTGVQALTLQLKTRTSAPEFAALLVAFGEKAEKEVGTDAAMGLFRVPELLEILLILQQQANKRKIIALNMQLAWMAILMQTAIKQQESCNRQGAIALFAGIGAATAMGLSAAYGLRKTFQGANKLKAAAQEHQGYSKKAKDMDTGNKSNLSGIGGPNGQNGPSVATSVNHQPALSEPAESSAHEVVSHRVSPIGNNKSQAEIAHEERCPPDERMQALQMDKARYAAQKTNAVGSLFLSTIPNMVNSVVDGVRVYLSKNEEGEQDVLRASAADWKAFLELLIKIMNDAGDKIASQMSDYGRIAGTLQGGVSAATAKG